MSFSLESILAPSSLGRNPQRRPSPRGKTTASLAPPSQNPTPHTTTNYGEDLFTQDQRQPYRHITAQHHHHYRPHIQPPTQYQSHFHQLPPASHHSYNCPHSTSYSESGYGTSLPANLQFSNSHSSTHRQPHQPPLSHQEQTQPQIQSRSTTQDRQHHWTSQLSSEEDDSSSSEPYSEITVDSPSPHDDENDDNDTTNNNESDNSSSTAEDNPSLNFGYGTSFLSNFIEPRHIQPQTHTLPPIMSPSATRRRSMVVVDDEGEPSTVADRPVKKRRRVDSDCREQLNPVHQTKSIEEVDLTAEDEPLNVTLQKQRTDAVKAQQQGPAGMKTKLSTLQCTVCLESPTDLTATTCGHTFCRNCVMNWLISAEKDPARRPNCPACRKPLKRTSKIDTTPMEIMRRPKT